MQWLFLKQIFISNLIFGMDNPDFFSKASLQNYESLRDVFVVIIANVVCMTTIELRSPKMPPKITSPFLLCWKLRLSKCLTMTSLAPCFTDPLTSSTPINAVVNEQVRAQELFSETIDLTVLGEIFYGTTTQMWEK